MLEAFWLERAVADVVDQGVKSRRRYVYLSLYIWQGRCWAVRRPLLVDMRQYLHACFSCVRSSRRYWARSAGFLGGTDLMIVCTACVGRVVRSVVGDVRTLGLWDWVRAWNRVASKTLILVFPDSLEVVGFSLDVVAKVFAASFHRC